MEAIRSVKGFSARVERAREMAMTIADEDAEFCRRIGEHGVEIIKEIQQRTNGEVVNILTHCNAGWLAFVDYGLPLLRFMLPTNRNSLCMSG
jgi:methylthioribose-1-phosphate isomerase